MMAFDNMHEHSSHMHENKNELQSNIDVFCKHCDLIYNISNINSVIKLLRNGTTIFSKSKKIKIIMYLKKLRHLNAKSSNEKRCNSNTLFQNGYHSRILLFACK